MSSKIDFKISDIDYARTPEQLTALALDYETITDNFRENEIFDLVSMIYKSAPDINVASQRLAIFAEMNQAGQQHEMSLLQKEYSSGTDTIRRMEQTHIALLGRQPDFPIFSLQMAKEVMNSDALASFNNLIYLETLGLYKTPTDLDFAAQILRLRSGTAEHLPLAPSDFQKLYLDTVSPEDLKDIAKAEAVLSESDTFPTLPWFLMSRTSGSPHVVPPKECVSMEENRRRPERMEYLWSLKERGLGYEIESHKEDLQAWVVPATDHYGNIILATKGDNPTPVANEDDLSDIGNKVSGLRHLRERYVSPEYRGQGIGSALIIARESAPFLARKIYGSGIFSEGGFMSRKSAYETLAAAFEQKREAALDKKDNSPIPTIAPTPTISKDRTPTPF